MSEKKKKNTVKSHKGEGNQKTKRRKAAQDHAKKKKEGQSSDKSNDSSQVKQKPDGSEDKRLKENSTVSEEAVVSDVEKDEELDNEVVVSSEESLVETELNETSNETSSEFVYEGLEKEDSTLVEDQINDIEQEIHVDETKITEPEQDQNTLVMTEEVIQSTEEITTETEQLPLEIIEDTPRSSIGQTIKNKFVKYGKPIDLEKFLLPLEELLSSKMVIYFDEWQIFLGFFILLGGLISYPFVEILGLSVILFLSGLTLMTTGYASEEVHITNSRILIRRMDWVDRMFRIPRDSQYILDEIVAFDVQRAPMNKALFLSGLMTFLPLMTSVVQESMILSALIVVLGLVTIILSQRLGKRTLSFLMSGGHQVHIGQYKGIPYSVVETFIKIIMEKNVFQSDSY